MFWDGVKVAHHYNAFTPFEGIVKNVSKGEHKLRVRVDNTFGEHSALHIPNDYYTYGGITRPVAMETLKGAYIKNVRFTPSCTDGKWSAKIEATVCNLCPSPMDAEIRVSVKKENAADGICLGGHIAVEAKGENILTFVQDFEDVIPWSHERPQLYLLDAQLCQGGILTDDLRERVGFRTVEVRGRKIYLNGEELYLKGFNRHEDYAVAGCAVPLQLMVQDLDLIQDMGANAVRTCHYPNDERFLDLCDERGIFVWEENHARGLSLENMQNPNFDRQCEDCIREMIENHYNHPSIVIWGILNECASEAEEGRKKYKRQYEQIKSLDKSRPTTSATCRHFTDICLDLPDIVSFNMYSGWYTDDPVDGRNRREIDWIREAGGADAPIIVSELGAAAVYGYRDRSRCKWSEERQRDLLCESLAVYMADENISGVFIWQFADCRVTEEGGWFATRARCHNNKGVVDEYRRPKLSYDAVKEMFGKDKLTKLQKC